MSDLKVPAELKYTKEDEWIRVEGDIYTIGVTDYAQDALSDIVYLELPEAGATFKQGDIFGVVESVKAVSDLYMPMDAEVVEANDSLIDSPELVNDDPYGDAWMLKVKVTDSAQLDELMDAEAYQAYCDERG